MQHAARLTLLNNVLSHSRKSSFYAQRVPEQPLAALTELARIPLTTKDDLRCCAPYDLVCVPLEALWQYHESYGTTGAPVTVWLTEDDMRVSAGAIAHSSVGLQPGDLALVRFPYAISMIAHEFHTACHMRGTCVVPASSRSSISPFPRVVQLMRKLGVTVLAALPLQALLLAETAELMGFPPGEAFPRLRAICTAGEILTPRKRELLMSLWHVPVFDNYGTTELGPLALDCAYGRLHVLSDDFVVELLQDDLKTPVADGEVGNLVVTTLRRQATPMVRYLVGDKARLVHEQCRCGAESHIEVHGRASDVIEISGRKLTAWDIEAILAQLSSSRYWAAGPCEDGLRLVVEAVEQEKHVSDDLCRPISALWGVPISLEVVPRGSLYDRTTLLDVGVVGKPRYLYTAKEMADQAYLHAAKL